MVNVLKIVIILSLLSIYAPGWADIYRYEDEKGVVHFANHPRNPHFKLYIRDKKEKGEGMADISAGFVSSGLVHNNYDSLISEVSRKYQVDFALIKAIIRVESGFNPTAVSHKGARGLMQLMPGTASQLNVSNPLDPQQNIEGGVRHFKYLLSRFDNDVRLSLAAYNAGEEVVSKTGAIPPYRETMDYVGKVLHFYRLNKEQEQRMF